MKKIHQNLSFFHLKKVIQNNMKKLPKEQDKPNKIFETKERNNEKKEFENDDL